MTTTDTTDISLKTMRNSSSELKKRNAGYKEKTQNIFDAANKYKGKYALRFKDKSGRKVDVKISILPIELCEFKGIPLYQERYLRLF